MKNYTFITRLILILLLAGGSCLKGFAEGVGLDNLPAENLDFKNPFVSLLPKKEVPKKEVGSVAKPTPVATAPEKEVIPPSLIIRGLVWNSDSPQAIINENVVGLGDTIEDAKITAIKRTGIEILFEGKYFTVSPNEQTARSSAKSFDSRQDNRLR